VENDWKGLLQHCIPAYNRLIVGDTNLSGQRLRVYYECTIGAVACVASFKGISLNHSIVQQYWFHHSKWSYCSRAESLSLSATWLDPACLQYIVSVVMTYWLLWPQNARLLPHFRTLTVDFSH